MRPISELIPPALPPTSVTTGSASQDRPGASAIGWPAGKRGVATQPTAPVLSLALSPAANDQNLEAALPSGLRQALVPVVSQSFQQGGYQENLTRFEIKAGTDPAEISAALSQVRSALAPCPSSTCRRELTRLKAVTASRDRAEIDETLMAQAYLDELQAYPADVVVDACRSLARSSRFFPSLAELTDALDWRVARRRRLGEALERAARMT